MEEGTTTTPFDMVVRNQLSRYHLAIEALRRTTRLKDKANQVIAAFEEKLTQHKYYIRENLEDMPEIRNWRWQA
jgi:xylulose-5-phosphate/fructose-6-phosphate phosphoketolase